MRILSSLLFLVLVAWASPALADAGSPTSLCVYSYGVCVPLSSTAPLPTKGSAATALTPVAPMQKGLSVAAATSLTVPTGATLAQIICTAAINWEDDGSAPTATVGSGGMGLLANTLLSYSAPLSAIQLISQTGSGTCSVAYYK